MLDLRGIDTDHPNTWWTAFRDSWRRLDFRRGIPFYILVSGKSAEVTS